MIDIIVDLDETIVDLFTPWLAMYNKDYNDTLCVENILTYNISKYVKPECGDKIYDYIYTPNLFTNIVKAKPGAVVALKLLKDLGNHIIIASSVYPRPGCERVELDKRTWCKNNLSFIPETDIHITMEKYKIPGNIFIDDCPEQVINYRKHYPCSIIIGIDYPYNKNMKEYSFKVPSGFMSWTQIFSFIYKFGLYGGR